MRIDEHVSEYASLAAGAVEPGEGEMTTWSTGNLSPKFTVK
jgi:hypothetical protein